MSDVNDISHRVFVDPVVEQRVGRFAELTFDELAECKVRLESEIGRFLGILSDLGSDMDSPLIVGGFPRADVDVYQVRYVRRLVNMCRNDLVKIVDQLHVTLGSQLQTNKGSSQGSQSSSSVNPNYKPLIPFATIVEVVAGGPMDRAGGKVGDRVCSVGDVNVTNHDGLRALANHIPAQENTSVPLVVKRSDTVLHLTLVPTRKWNGQGLLGCRFQQL